MLKTFILVILVFFSLLNFGQNITDLKIGDQISFYSDELKEDRVLNIYLPNGYHPDSTKNYPVIYLLDGSMHEDMLHITGLVQFCSYSWINIIPECIVVGISNVNRYRDFTHIPENKEYLETDPSRGGADQFIQFLQKEVIPKIESKYPVNDHKSIIGQSLGGLLATQVLFEQPSMFDHYFIISPSLWYDDERLLSQNISPFTEVASIYIAVGNEGKIMKKVAKALYKKLKSNNTFTKIDFEYFPKHDHGDVLHQAMYDGFEKVGETFKLKSNE